MLMAILPIIIMLLIDWLINALRQTYCILGGGGVGVGVGGGGGGGGVGVAGGRGAGGMYFIP